MRCVLFPSIEEGLPNVVVEAMAVGLPVVTTNCGGVGEIITNGKNGWLVDIGDVSAMSVALHQLYGLPISEINTITKQARSDVEAQHSEQNMIDGMLRLYEEVAP